MVVRPADCCGRAMQRIDVHSGVIVAYTCGTCRSQRWFIVEEEVSEGFATSFAKRLI